MGKLVFKDAYFDINSVDLSDHVQKLELTYKADTPDVTAMGDDTKVSGAGGLFDWPVTLTLFQDFGSGSVDATLFPLVGTVVAIQINPDSSVTGTSNPKFTGNVLVESYQPMSGSVGQELMTTLTLKPAGTLSRATS